MRLFAIICALALTLSSEGQSTPQRRGLDISSASGRQGSALSVHQIDLGSANVVEGPAVGAAMVLPIKCTSDATAYISMLLPGFENHALYAVHRGKSSLLEAKNIPGLKDVTTLDFFPSDSEFAFLVRGTPSDTSPSVASEEAAKRTKAEQPYFVAVFTHSGEFKRLLSPPEQLPVDSLALLGSGEVILSGYDIVNHVPRMLILSRSGQIERAVDQPLPAEDRVGGLGAELAAAGTHFVLHGQNVLVWRMGGNGPLIEIASGGATREIPLQLQRGDALIDVVPSQDQDPFIVHVDKATAVGVSQGGKPDVGPGRYIEVSPLDGAAIREITLPASIGNPIACKVDGSYVVFSGNMKGQLLEYQGQ